MDFHTRFKEAVENSPMSYADVARALGVTKATVCNYKQGKIKPDLEKFRMLCMTLEISADYLLGITEF